MLVPRGVDDPLRPSGGNTYDRRVCAALRDLGWQVEVGEVGERVVRGLRGVADKVNGRCALRHWGAGRKEGAARVLRARRRRATRRVVESGVVEIDEKALRARRLRSRALGGADACRRGRERERAARVVMTGWSHGLVEEIKGRGGGDGGEAVMDGERQLWRRPRQERRIDIEHYVSRRPVRPACRIVLKLSALKRRRG